MDSSNEYYTHKLWLVKEYNIKVWFGTWGVDVGLWNHVKIEFANSLHYLFTLSTLIILLIIIFIKSNLH
jgi:hypothetical protein